MALQGFQKKKFKIIAPFIANEKREEQTYLGLTLVVGFVSALIAVGLHKLTHYATHYFRTDQPLDLKSYGIGLVLVLISGFITHYFYNYTTGSGVPGLRIALAVFHGKIKFSDTIAKFVVSCLSLSSGFLLRKEAKYQ